MSGFPEKRSQMFQCAFGQLAYSVFNARQKMSHGLEKSSRTRSS
ncbi:DUF1569 domain-containing protein [Cognatiyoonia sediminum]